MENNTDGTSHSEFKEVLSRKVTSFINDEKNLTPKRMGRRVFQEEDSSMGKAYEQSKHVKKDNAQLLH